MRVCRYWKFEGGRREGGLKSGPLGVVFVKRSRISSGNSCQSTDQRAKRWMEVASAARLLQRSTFAQRLCTAAYRERQPVIHELRNSYSKDDPRQVFFFLFSLFNARGELFKTKEKTKNDCLGLPTMPPQLYSRHRVAESPPSCFVCSFSTGIFGGTRIFPVNRHVFGCVLCFCRLTGTPGEACLVDVIRRPYLGQPTCWK